EADGSVREWFGICADIQQRKDADTKRVEAVTKLERERDNKLTNVEAIMAAIAHEVRQPLMAIAISGSAARRFLARVPADIDEVAANLDRIINDSRRASEVFDSILALFRREDQERQPIDNNKIALEVLQSSRGELADRRVTTR